jgi:hypothetical protein
MNVVKSNQPAWWKDEHSTSWDRVKEALRRDWDQTKFDLHVGGHELNQDFEETARQMKGAPIPPIDRANPPKVLKDVSLEWEREEEPVRYGYGARVQYGTQHPRWTPELEGKLRTEWAEWTGMNGAKRPWEDVRPAVRHGYEYDDRHKS